MDWTHVSPSNSHTEALISSMICLEVEVIRSWGGALMKESVSSEKRQERDDLDLTRTEQEGDNVWTRKRILTRHTIYQHLDRGSRSLKNSGKYMSVVQATQFVVFCYSGLNWLSHTWFVKHDCHIWSINLHQRRWEYTMEKKISSISGVGKTGQLHVAEWN